MQIAFSFKIICLARYHFTCNPSVAAGSLTIQSSPPHLREWVLNKQQLVILITAGQRFSVQEERRTEEKWKRYHYERQILIDSLLSEKLQAFKKKRIKQHLHSHFHFQSVNSNFLASDQAPTASTRLSVTLTGCQAARGRANRHPQSLRRCPGSGRSNWRRKSRRWRLLTPQPASHPAPSAHRKWRWKHNMSCTSEAAAKRS